ncbi:MULTISPECIES: N-acetylmannosamine-6-phosphate 2-epimerase [Terribacillus]|uniref:Putative N-acetylmannosamine-6-phosphate 2-epimerase n=1 Tax=Terribacillus saccharophilus TaxID=361277 RepID=A0ABX4GZA5_9BACI|nr:MULTISPECIES: N-acetylmannosamine-6-phosphate 2-epimerase [Terribacillus]PAD35485.1 N-acetylmannosamine-6-phosphate 2-epimerase [Terribacillus saccharophilus]PAD96554.1 N-acetylmannosamine-6-phosphate 2-epimerase [Terribacillus saccharophilus]PAE00130.1 N-acetylmannosamine-6-phosphate 2-epimerase [Terribacillus saccharophilus]
MLNEVKHNLIVSCQALPEEPLHSSFIMSKMALAAKQGGAKGIRANSKEDIIEIKKEVSLPVVGIIKRDYKDSSVYITPTYQEIDELLESGCEMIAMDATERRRPEGIELGELVRYVREKDSSVQLMADIATLEDAIQADQLGFDCVSTTLYGYTEETKNNKLYDNDFEFLKRVLDNVSIPVIAEGNVITPEMAKRCLQLGAYSVVVGGAITRPQQITERFVDIIN